MSAVLGRPAIEPDPIRRRLQRLADRPGLVARHPSDRLLQRHEHLTAGLPLSALIVRHGGVVATRSRGDLPVVFATSQTTQPAGTHPGAVGSAAPSAPVTLSRTPTDGPVIQRKATPATAVAAALPVPAAQGPVLAPVSPVAAARPASPGSLATPGPHGPARVRESVRSPALGSAATVAVTATATSPASTQQYAGIAAGLAPPPGTRPSRPDPVSTPHGERGPEPARRPEPARGPEPAPASSETVVVAVETGLRPDGGARLPVATGPEPVPVPMPVLRASPNPTSPVHPSSSLAEPVAVHPSSEQPLGPGVDHVGLGASRALPVVPLPVTVPHATSRRRTLPLTAAAGPAMPAALSANSAAVELGGASTRAVTGTVGGAGPTVQPGSGTSDAWSGVPLPSAAAAPPVDVDAIAATVQRRVLRRFELEAERRGARR